MDLNASDVLELFIQGLKLPRGQVPPSAPMHRVSAGWSNVPDIVLRLRQVCQFAEGIGRVAPWEGRSTCQGDHVLQFGRTQSATTNFVDTLDAPLSRNGCSGRFIRVVHPDIDEATAIVGFFT